MTDAKFFERFVLEEMEHNSDSETNEFFREDSSEIDSSQESQSNRKLVVTASRNSSRREKKAKKFNFKKGEKLKVCRNGLFYLLAHHH